MNWPASGADGLSDEDSLVPVQDQVRGGGPSLPNRATQPGYPACFSGLGLVAGPPARQLANRSSLGPRGRPSATLIRRLDRPTSLLNALSAGVREYLARSATA
jgi:hypothetical protein